MPRVPFEVVDEPRVCGPGFHTLVADAVRRVPAGRVGTYGDVASVLGSPRVARQVGWALAALPADSDVPWHRVINARGLISHRGDLIRGEEQQRRLEAEGVAFDPSGAVDLALLRWDWGETEESRPRRR